METISITPIHLILLTSSRCHQDIDGDSHYCFKPAETAKIRSPQPRFSAGWSPDRRFYRPVHCPLGRNETLFCYPRDALPPVWPLDFYFQGKKKSHKVVAKIVNADLCGIMCQVHFGLLHAFLDFLGSFLGLRATSRLTSPAWFSVRHLDRVGQRGAGRCFGEAQIELIRCREGSTCFQP